MNEDSRLYGLALNERIAKIGQLWNSFSQIWNENFEMTIICSIILFITWSFSFLNDMHISKVPEHYINRKMQYSTACAAVNMTFYNLWWPLRSFFHEKLLLSKNILRQKDYQSWHDIAFYAIATHHQIL
mgnify:CR=1 FL=1